MLEAARNSLREREREGERGRESEREGGRAGEREIVNLRNICRRFAMPTRKKKENIYVLLYSKGYRKADPIILRVFL